MSVDCESRASWALCCVTAGEKRQMWKPTQLQRNTKECRGRRVVAEQHPEKRKWWSTLMEAWFPQHGVELHRQLPLFLCLPANIFPPFSSSSVYVLAGLCITFTSFQFVSSGPRGAEMLQLLKDNAPTAVAVIIKRVQQKQEEW